MFWISHENIAVYFGRRKTFAVVLGFYCLTIVTPPFDALASARSHVGRDAAHEEHPLPYVLAVPSKILSVGLEKWTTRSVLRAMRRAATDESDFECAVKKLFSAPDACTTSESTSVDRLFVRGAVDAVRMKRGEIDLDQRWRELCLCFGFADARTEQGFSSVSGYLKSVSEKEATRSDKYAGEVLPQTKDVADFLLLLDEQADTPLPKVNPGILLKASEATSSYLRSPAGSSIEPAQSTPVTTLLALITGFALLQSQEQPALALGVSWVQWARLPFAVDKACLRCAVLDPPRVDRHWLEGYITLCKKAVEQRILFRPDFSLIAKGPGYCFFPFNTFQHASVLESWDANADVFDSLLEVVDSPYIFDYLLREFNIMFVGDSSPRLIVPLVKHASANPASAPRLFGVLYRLRKIIETDHDVTSVQPATIWWTKLDGEISQEKGGK